MTTNPSDHESRSDKKQGIGARVPRKEDARLMRGRGQYVSDMMLPGHVGKLRGLRAIKFDWGRYDSTYSHVYANQAFTRKLDDYGVPHVAEEHGGGSEAHHSGAVRPSAKRSRPN